MATEFVNLGGRAIALESRAEFSRMDLTQEWNELQIKLHEVQQQIKDVETRLNEQVKSSGPIQGHGVAAYYKPGKKFTDHEGICEEFDIPQDLVAENTTVKRSVKWSAVTKAAQKQGLISKKDLEAHTSQEPPKFVAELVK